MIILMAFKVSGHSMEPAFKPGQILLVSSLPYVFQKPKVDDVVVVKDPRDPSASHSTVSSDRIGSGQAGRLLLKRITACHPGMTFEVAGDNPQASTDSRTFGAIARKDILGKVIWG